MGTASQSGPRWGQAVEAVPGRQLAELDDQIQRLSDPSPIDGVLDAGQVVDHSAQASVAEQLGRPFRQGLHLVHVPHLSFRTSD